jgi:phenylacetate-CoA ligase
MVQAPQFPVQRLRDVMTDHYLALPSPFQDVVCSTYGLQEIVRRRGWPRVASSRREHIASLHWDADAAQRVVETRLRRILDAARDLPGYRDLAPRTSGGSALDELERWPILTKEQLRKQPNGFLTRKVEPTDVFSLTSGTTGTPLKIWRPRYAFQELFLSADVFKGWHGVRPWSRRASFTGRVVAAQDDRRVWRLNLPALQLVLSQYHIRPADVGRYRNALQVWRPKVLEGYASNCTDLARLFQQDALSVTVPLTITTSEVLTSASRALISEVFGGRVVDKYGSSENVAYACECPFGSHHIFQNVGWFEAVDAEGCGLPAGQPGRLLVTTLVNDLMPLIRYEIGDMGSVDGTAQCPCGRTSPILRDICGRQDDTVVGPDGSRIMLFAYNLLRGLDGVIALQVIQQDLERFVVRAHLDDDRVESRADFERSILLAFERMLGESNRRRVSFEYSPEGIERTPGGKIRNVISVFS